MLRWLRGNKGARELAAARAEVERAQRALLPLQAGLVGPLALRVSASERVWREARAAEERGDAEGEARARQGYREVQAELAAVQSEILARTPELAVAAFLAQAEELLVELEDAGARAAAWVELLATRLATRDAAGTERMLAAVLSGEGALPASAAFLCTLSEAELAFGPAPWLTEARARVAASLGAFTPDTPEGAVVCLELVQAQAESGACDEARAALQGLAGDYRDLGLLALAEAEARAGALDAARATAAEIEGREARLAAEVAFVGALANAEAGDARALAAARALPDEVRARALVHVVAARARAGELAAALELAAELEGSEREEAHHWVFDELLERRDFTRAAELALSFDGESRDFGRVRLCETRAYAGDGTGAFAAAEEIEDPYLQAMTLENLGWWRFGEGDPEGGRAAFAHALALAAEVVRRGAGPRRPGEVGQHWLDLGTRLHGALGDGASAVANVARQDEPHLRAAGWLELGTACGRMGDFDAAGALVASLPSNTDRAWLLCGLARGVRIGLDTRGNPRRPGG